MQKTPKNPKKYNYEKCNFTSSNKKDYNKHLTTTKHINTTNTTIIQHINTQQHTCTYVDTMNDNILLLLKQNQELKRLMVELFYCFTNIVFQISEKGHL